MAAGSRMYPKHQGTVEKGFTSFRHKPCKQNMTNVSWGAAHKMLKQQVNFSMLIPLAHTVASGVNILTNLACP